MATVRAIDTFAAITDAGVIGVQVGQEFDDKDPIVKARPHLFKSDNQEPAKRRGRPPKVEQATAAPGEVRDL